MAFCCSIVMCQEIQNDGRRRPDSQKSSPSGSHHLIRPKTTNRAKPFVHGSNGIDRIVHSDNHSTTSPKNSSMTKKQLANQNAGGRWSCPFVVVVL